MLPDARASEDWLWSEVTASAAHVLAEPGRLAAPALIVVPSRSLREHLAARLVARGAPALLGLRILTLEGLARELLARAGQAVGDSTSFAIWLRRLAGAEPSLAAPLEGLADGYAAVVASVDDLLDAGLTPAHAEVLEERVAALGEGGATSRAAALIRVAARLGAMLDSGVTSHRSKRLRAARELLEGDPESMLPARALWIVGFQDATGVQADLLEALVRLRGARVLFESPLHAGAPTQALAPFGARLRERLGAVRGLRDADHAHRSDARVEVVRAPDREAEVRELAAALRERLDAGATPERIAVVARDLAPYRIALRRQLDRLAVPFSGCGEPGVGGRARAQLDALLLLLERGVRTPSERWLEAVAVLPDAPGERPAPLSFARRAALRRALHRRGKVQLADLAALGEATAAGPRGAEAPSLMAAARAAAALCDDLEHWPEAAPQGAHLARLRDLVERGLGWGDSMPGFADFLAVLTGERLARDARLVLDREELLTVLREALADHGRGSLGGAGGGVQVLGVMEARSRSFDAVHVLGLNRGVFPRLVNEDPMLPDAVRRQLRDVLPDLPIKREGHDEERFLFSQLIASAPVVVASCARADDDGHTLAPSPMLERLVAAGRATQVREAPPLHASMRAGRPRPAFEHALLAGLRGGVGAQQALLPLAMASWDGSAASPRAAARSAVLREIDAFGGAQGSLGPYFGFVGPRDDRGPPSVTFLEQLIRCPWRAFVTRILHVEPAPDALDALPSVDRERLLLGSVVHAVLEELVAEALPHDGGGLEAPASAVAWPDPQRVASTLERVAQEKLRESANPIPGYAGVLARRAAPYVEVARRADWSGAAVPVVDVEVAASARLPVGDGEREVRFRADRVDRMGERLRLTDYKTGRSPLSRQPRKREEQLLAGAARGELLQAVVYASAADRAEGRYLFLRPDDEDAAREGALALEVGAALEASLDASLVAAFGAYDEGVFPPRLRRHDRDAEPSTCRACAVKEACLRGDSGARGRVGRFIEHQDGKQGSAPLRAAAGIWRLEVRA